MKKYLLLSALFFSSIGLFAQTPCPTCYQGAHWGTIKWDSTLHPMAHNVGNGNNGLGTTPSYLNQNVCGLNYLTVSQVITTRATWQPGTGFPATFPLPNCLGSTVKAFLYWGISYFTNPVPTYTANITDPNSNTTSYPATLIGTGPPKCWGDIGTAAYRADITAAMTVGGSYSISLSGQTVATEDYDIDGMTLVYIYSEPATYSGSISLWDGCNAWNGSGPDLSQTFTGINVCAASPTASAFVACGDMQNNVAPSHVESENGTSGTFPNTFWNTDVLNTTVTAAQTTSTYSVDVGNSGDCYSWILAGLYWQNTTCQTCVVPGTLIVTLTSGDPTCGNINGWVTANVTGGVSPYTYRWSNGQTTMTISSLSAGTYSVMVKDNTGCDSTPATVTLVTTSVRVTPTYTNIACNGQCNGSIHISASGGVPPFTFSWSPNVGLDSSATNLCAGSYTVTVKDNNGCTTIDTLTITQPPALTVSATATGESCNGGTNGTATALGAGGTPPYIYNWSNGNTGATISGLSTGTYTVTLVDANNCIATATATVTQPAALQVTITGPALLCNNQSGTLKANVTGGTSPYAYVWVGSPSVVDSAIVTPTVTTTYTVDVTDANGCTTSSTITVTLGPPITVSISGVHSLCAGSSITLCANVTGGTGGNIYLWQPGNLNSACINILPAASTTYSVTVYDNCGTNASATAYLPVNPLPQISFITDVTKGCSPLCIQFRDKSAITQGHINAWAWTFGDGDTSIAENPIYCYGTPGNYPVSLTAVSDSGCSATLSVSNMITVYTHPIAQFSDSPQPADILNPNIQFTDQTTDSYGLSYWWWNFGDGADSNSSLQNPSHTYQDTGTYCPQLVAMNIHGCTDTITHCFEIAPAFTLYIPDAFSPNGDGKNEVFMAKGSYISSFDMYIYDRWGTQIFHSNDINTGWNGAVNNGSTACQEDTYVYKIFVTDTKKKQHNYIGSVTLIR